MKQAIQVFQLHKPSTDNNSQRICPKEKVNWYKYNIAKHNLRYKHENSVKNSHESLDITI